MGRSDLWLHIGVCPAYRDLLQTHSKLQRSDSVGNAGLKEPGLTRTITARVVRKRDFLEAPPLLESLIQEGYAIVPVAGEDGIEVQSLESAPSHSNESAGDIFHWHTQDSSDEEVQYPASNGKVWRGSHIPSVSVAGGYGNIC